MQPRCAPCCSANTLSYEAQALTPQAVTGGDMAGRRGAAKQAAPCCVLFTNTAEAGTGWIVWVGPPTLVFLHVFSKSSISSAGQYAVSQAGNRVPSVAESLPPRSLFLSLAACHWDLSLVISKEPSIRWLCAPRPGLEIRALSRSHASQLFSMPNLVYAVCTLAVCRIPQIEDAEIHNKTYRYGDKLIIACRDGFKIRYPNLYNLVSLCRDDGTWDNLPICQGMRRQPWLSAALLAERVGGCVRLSLTG